MLATFPFINGRVFNLNLLGMEIPIDPWATLVCLGIVLGMELARYRTIRLGLDTRDVVDGTLFTVGMGFVVAHIVTVLFYFPERLQEDGIMSLLRLWEGFSSTGGFIGAVIGSVVFYKWIRPRDYFRYADIITYGFPLGWFFGRVGCAVVHDHIGSETDFFLAVEFPSWHYAAGIRHDLGLYEALYTLPIILLFVYLGRKDRVPGFFLGLFGMLYAPMRFVSDFLRNVDLEHQDARYLGLTPAQYGMILMFLASAALFYSRIRKKDFKPWPMDGEPNQAERANAV